MIRWIFVMMIVPLTAAAEPARIRSGEHETFSRLVVSIETGTDWQIRPTSGGYILELADFNDGFDASRVFERIPKTRLLAATQQELNTLYLASDCDCHADAFLWQPNELVIDIIDGPDPDDPDTVPTSVDPVVNTSPSPVSQLPNLLTMRLDAAPSPSSTDIPLAAEAELMLLELKTTEEALLQGLARATSQGILEPATDPQSESDQIVMTETGPQIPTDLHARPLITGQPGIGISTAMDRDLAFVEGILKEAMEPQCLSDDLFQIADWADDRAIHTQIAALAEGLAGEFGQEPLEAEEQLARLYIHFGFGAEARAVLHKDTAMSQSRRVLVELAGIVDDYEGSYPLMAAQSGCPTSATLWAFYANPTALDEEHRNDVLQRFFALPQPLRGQLAPRLARKFVEVEDPNAASDLLRASENRDVAATHDLQSTRALIAEEMDDPQGAIAVLEREAGDNARTTPRSLIQLIELELQNGQVPQEEDLLLMATMRQEFRGTPQAQDLAIAEAKGRIALGQYHDALGLVAGSESPEMRLVVNQAFADLTLNASAADFLEFGFGPIADGTTPSTYNAMARRMIDLGFPERATELLHGPAAREAASERRYLRAEAALGLGNYVDALDAVLGMSDVRARTLRADAYSGLGEYREALAASDPQAPAADETELEFRAGAWERLTIDDDDVLSDFAQAVLTPGTSTPVETLADRRAILAQSEESRQAVEQLLLRFDGETPQE